VDATAALPWSTLATQTSNIFHKAPWTMMSQGNTNTEASARRRSQQPASRSIFDVPAPIKQLFDIFPLVTYPINHLPQRAPQHRNAPVLHVFTTTEGASIGAPSYNPACLKWQVWKTDVAEPHIQAHFQHRRILSFPTLTSGSSLRAIMHPQVARCHSSFLHSHTPLSLYSRCLQASCNDGR
jgi:hypothetical protein